MVITPELRAEIVRLFHAEGWRKSDIANQYGLHHSTVGRVLAKEAGLPRVAFRRRTKVDPYLPFIRQTLEKFPKLNVMSRGIPPGLNHDIQPD